jgi:minor extracellular serine protease Vpr
MNIRSILFVFHIFLGLWSFSQLEMPGYTADLLEKVASFSVKNKAAALPPELAQSFNAVFLIDGEKYYGFLAYKSQHFNRDELKKEGILISTETSKMVNLKVPSLALPKLSQLQSLRYLELPYEVSPHLDRLLGDVRAPAVHSGTDLPQAYTGKDVIIGVIDWGFDFTHPMFYDSVLQRYRVIACWDQWKNAGPSPIAYRYGTEIEGQANLLAAGSDTANNRGYDTHGTHVAGIAGGGGARINALGVAPECDFLFVQIVSNAGAIADAVDWMYQKARSLDKRLVINMSFGNYHRSTLDSFSFYHDIIREYTQKGVVMVTSAGNNGARNCHIKKDFNTDLDTMRTQVLVQNILSGYNGQRVIMWGNPEKSFQCKFELYGPNNQLLYISDTYSTASSNPTFESVEINNVVFSYDLELDKRHPLNKKPRMNVLFTLSDESYKVVLKSWADDGVVHYWNIIERNGRTSNTGMPFQRIFNNFTEGDNFYTVSDPAVVVDVITVAAHNAEIRNTSGTGMVPGPRAPFSSLGPTPEEVVKPDISAPGASILSSVSSFTTENYQTAESVNFQGKSYDFARFSGTSMSGPAIAGVAALLLEANPKLSHFQIKDIIRQTAYEDIHTGELPLEGNLFFGKGKVDAYKAIQMALNIKGEYFRFFETGTVFPNPTSSKLFYALGNENFDAELIDMMGKVVIKGRISISESFDVSTLNSGMYFLRVFGEKTTVAKVIIHSDR